MKGFRLWALGFGSKFKPITLMNEYGYRSLLVWQKGKTLATDIYRLTNCESIKRDFSLVDQMRRSAVSVPSNIAEGDERSSDKDSVRFFNIARGSLARAGHAIGNRPRCRYFKKCQDGALDWKMFRLGKMLGALIRARSAPNSQVSGPKPTA